MKPEFICAGDNSTIEEFWVGELNVWIANGLFAYLAAGIRGDAPRELHTALEETIDNVHVLKGSALKTFSGDASGFATEGFAALSRLPDEILRCQTAAKRIGNEIGIEIRGSAEAVGNEAKNLELIERRARAVRDFLVSCGLDAGMLKTLARVAPPVASAGTKPAAEESDRRVAFRVVVQP